MVILLVKMDEKRLEIVPGFARGDEQFLLEKIEKEKDEQMEIDLLGSAREEFLSKSDRFSRSFFFFRSIVDTLKLKLKLNMCDVSAMATVSLLRLTPSDICRRVDRSNDEIRSTMKDKKCCDVSSSTSKCILLFLFVSARFCRVARRSVDSIRT